MSKFQNKYTTETAKVFAETKNCKLDDVYRGMNEKHRFICACGEPFITTFAKFQNRGKCQCNKCGRNNAKKLFMLTIDEVRNRILKHGCELVSDIYTSATDKNLVIRCHCGKLFTTSLACYENSKHQCLDCSQKDANEYKNKYRTDYIKELCLSNNALLVSEHGEFIGTKDPVEIKCSICGKIFKTTLGYVLSANKFICNDCSYKNSPSSKGELEIKDYLDSLNVSYKEQYSFNDCKYKYKLRFDFAVFIQDQIKMIEYDGIQHFKPYEYYGGMETFENVKKRDFIKNDYCNLNGIPLLRIKYDDIDMNTKIYNFLFT